MKIGRSRLRVSPRLHSLTLLISCRIRAAVFPLVPLTLSPTPPLHTRGLHVRAILQLSNEMLDKWVHQECCHPPVHACMFSRLDGKAEVIIINVCRRNYSSQ